MGAAGNGCTNGCTWEVGTVSKPFKVLNADGSVRLYRQAIELPPGPDGRRRKKFISAKRKSDLVAKVRAFEATLYRSGGNVALSTPTVSEWVEARIAHGIKTGELRSRTAQEYRGYLDRYITPSIGKVRVGKLTPAHVRQLHAYVLDELDLSPTTALNAHNILSGTLKMAVADGMVPDNVASKTTRPRAADYQAQVLSLAEIRALLAYAGRLLDEGDWWAIRIPIALYAGTRQGETLGLVRHVIDLEHRIMRIGYQLLRLETEPHKSLRAHHISGKYWLVPPKSKKGIREVPIIEPLALALEARLAVMPDDPWAPIVPGPAGGIIDPSADYKRWQAALKAAGVSRVRVHDARHSTGTLLRAAGVEQRIIQVILGHNSAAMTEHYSHLGEAEAHGAMVAFQRHIEQG